MKVTRTRLRKIGLKCGMRIPSNILSFKVRDIRATKKSICVKGSKMWNALSADLKLSRNVNAFKKMLKASL